MSKYQKHSRLLIAITLALLAGSAGYLSLRNHRHHHPRGHTVEQRRAFLLMQISQSAQIYIGFRSHAPSMNDLIASGDITLDDFTGLDARPEEVTIDNEGHATIPMFQQNHSSP